MILKEFRENHEFLVFPGKIVFRKSVSQKRFSNHHTEFPTKLIDTIVNKYVFLSKDKLTAELKAIYKNATFSVANCPSVSSANANTLNK